MGQVRKQNAQVQAPNLYCCCDVNTSPAARNQQLFETVWNVTVLKDIEFKPPAEWFTELRLAPRKKACLLRVTVLLFCSNDRISEAPSQVKRSEISWKIITLI